MPIIITDEVEKNILLRTYASNINKRSLKNFIKKKGYGDGGGGYMAIFFKSDLEEDLYMTQVELEIDISQFKDNQVLLDVDPPAAPVNEQLIIDFDEFYNYLAKVVDERISESPEDKEEYQELLAKVKTALEL
jgi:hypothetical protein